MIDPERINTFEYFDQFESNKLQSKLDNFQEHPDVASVIEAILEERGDVPITA
jgi:hypothetical protein